jgi:hypothetical protein
MLQQQQQQQQQQGPSTTPSYCGGLTAPHGDPVVSCTWQAASAFAHQLQQLTPRADSCGSVTDQQQFAGATSSAVERLLLLQQQQQYVNRADGSTCDTDAYRLHLFYVLGAFS